MKKPARGGLLGAIWAFLKQWAGGEGGIRTLGTEEPYAGFRIRCIRPLCHLSAVIAAAYIAYFCRCLVLPVKTGLVQERAAF
jgi:hypothetical protein